MDTPGDLVVIGRLGRPHGVNGAIRATATGPTLAAIRPGEDLLARPRVGRRAAPPGPAPTAAPAPARTVRLRASAPAGPFLILEFEGVDTREDAAALTNAELLVPGHRLPPPEDEDTFYVRDLLGYDVFAGDTALGRVLDVHAAPANDAIEVDAPGGRILLPFTADAVVALDRAARRITVRTDLLPGWAWSRDAGT